MPQILLKLMDLCQDEDAGMAEIAKLVANDAGMASRMMNIANSAAYQRGVRKVALVQALSTLGLDLIKTMVICESVFQTFNGFPHTSSTDLRGFWKHSLSTAVLARDIAKAMK
ncbi:MAG: histidine kinase, partial [Comamonadaceae bacterium CG17_big_fil_post_rev_8_21_14_2_50_60_13]